MPDHSETARQEPIASTAAPRFRLWPPVSVGAPWLAGYGVEQALWPSAALGTWAAVAGWVVLVVFAVWNGWSLALFARGRTGLLPGQVTTRLLTSGPYRLTRNPLYIGMLLLHVGGALVLGSLGALVTLPLAWAGMHWGAVLPEEQYLRTQLGEPYEEYRRRVPRWV